jgi:hypothetical protein
VSTIAFSKKLPSLHVFVVVLFVILWRSALRGRCDQLHQLFPIFSRFRYVLDNRLYNEITNSSPLLRCPPLQLEVEILGRTKPSLRCPQKYVKQTVFKAAFIRIGSLRSISAAEKDEVPIGALTSSPVSSAAQLP